MFELVLAGGIVAAAALAAARGHSRAQVDSMLLRDDPSRLAPTRLPTAAAQPADQHMVGLADLPCPWCLSATREDDTSCPSCGQPFG